MTHNHDKKLLGYIYIGRVYIFRLNIYNGGNVNIEIKIESDERSDSKVFRGT